jgi:Tol biopolymer transport system component
MQPKQYYLPDDDPPRRSLRDRLKSLREFMKAGWADTSTGLRKEWRNVTRSHPWLLRHRVLLLTGSISVALLLPVLVWYALNLRRTTQMPEGLQSRPLLAASGEKMQIALSADGKNAAFVWDGGQPNGNYDVYAMSTAPEDRAKAPRRITSNAAHDLHPAWSPDGTRLAFLRVTPDKIQLLLYLLKDNQELPMVVLDPKGWYNYNLDPLMTAVHPGPEWSADGDAVFVTDARNADAGVALWRVDVASSERDQLTHPSELRVDTYPRRIGSGRDLLFLRRSGAHVSEAFRVETTSDREQQLTELGRDLRGALMLPNGRDLIFSSDEGGRPQLRFFAPRAGTMVRIPVDGDYNFEPSYNARTLTWTSVRTVWSLWELALEGGEPPEGDRVLRQLPVPPGRNHSPAFSPDGRNLIWVSDTGGCWEFWTAAQPGGQPLQMSKLGEQWGSRFVSSPAWSPEGRRIAFEARPQGLAAVALTDPSAAAVKTVEENWHQEERPSWSQDGKWIYYSSNRDQVQQIWRRQVAGGNALRVTSREARQAFESFDGQTVYFVPGNSKPGIWSVNVNGGKEEVLPGTESYMIRGHWAVGPAGIFFMGYENEPRTLMFYWFSTGAVTPVLQLPKNLPADVSAMAVDRSGTRLIVVQQDELHSEAMIGRR